jgi:hypothetical protein
MGQIGVGRRRMACWRASLWGGTCSDMRLPLVLLVVALLAVVFLTLQRSDHATPIALERAPVDANEAVDSTSNHLAPDSVARVPPIADAGSSSESVPAQSDGVAAKAAVEPVVGEGDLEAKSPIVIRVVDDLDAPVADAEVSIWAMRPAQPGSGHYLNRGDPSLSSTDHEGRVHLEHWDWVTIDFRTGQVTIIVEHPNFVTYKGDLDIRPGEHVVHLERGATVVVTGWVADPTNVVHDLTLRVDRESNLGADAWCFLPDGRKATNRLPPGPHWIVATHMHSKLGRMSSAPQHFEVGGVGWETLHLQLHAPIDFVGQLDAAVPRPITAGHVQLVLTSGGLGGSRINLSDRYEAPIDTDGTFVIQDVRPGDGQIFALCRGWSSIETLADDPRQVGMTFSREPTEERKREELAMLGQRAFILQRAQVPQVESPIVVLMQRTCSLEVTILGPHGGPLEGAHLGASPTVRVMGVGSWIYPWRDWSAKTDANGVARIDNLPAHDDLWFHASAAGMRMSKRDRENPPRVSVSPGEVTTATLRLESGSD